MAVALETFVKQLEDSGIIAPGKLENYVPPNAHPKDAEELARQLVKADQLTPFQAQHVLLGKAKSLILGNYTILDKIGAGGMGQVFKAEHRRMHRIVAIKMLPPAMTTDAAALARFEREVTAAARLSHPNIVAAYDADEANGVHFFVMEYVDGKDLSALVKKNGPISVAEAVNYVRQAACGLAFAHAEGVVHRDIKPANLLLDKKGTVKILDMGLARIDSGGGDAATQAELTGTGAIMGTVDYMAPEQGVSTKNADARADIYSLGCALHYLLIGKPTFEGETVAAKLLAHHHQPTPNLCKLRKDVPAPLQAVFEKMLAKRIEERYQTMSEVVADLQPCGVGQEQSLIMQQSIASTAGNNALAFLDNDPAAATRKPRPTKQVVKPAGEGGFKNSRPLWIGAGAASFLAVLLGVIVIFRNPQGEEVGRIELPPGHTAEVQTTAPKPAIVPKVAGKLEAGLPHAAFNDPAFQQWLKTVAALPAERQVEAVAGKLQELNPGFDGKIFGWNWRGTPRIENGVATEFGFFTDNVTDISPVRALVGLKSLSCIGSADQGRPSIFSDLSPLRGMPLTRLNCMSNPVSDLSPLAGMPLTAFYCSTTMVADLSPLKGMPLTELGCGHTRVFDLSPLQGMKLTTLYCDQTTVSRLSELVGMPLTVLLCNDTRVSDLSPLRGMNLNKLSCYNTKVSDLSPLVDCQSLRILRISNTKVTATGVATLQKALPNCKITWDDPDQPTTPQVASPSVR